MFTQQVSSNGANQRVYHRPLASAIKDVEKRPSNMVLVTPELALLWLSQNIKRNRPASKKVIEKYARIMRRGEWRPNPSQPISFTKEGVLVNGQHRLEAVVKAGIPVMMAVVWDAEEGDFDVIDTGKKRSLGDIFALEGIKNYNTVSSIVSRYVALRSGFTLSMTSETGINVALDLAQDYLNEYHACDYVNSKGESCNQFQDIYHFAYNTVTGNLKMLTISDMGGIAMYLILEKAHSVDKVKSFFDALYFGGKTYSYLYELGVMLNNDIKAEKKMRPARKQSLIAKAWNMFLRDSKAIHLRLHMGEIVKFE